MRILVISSEHPQFSTHLAALLEREGVPAQVTGAGDLDSTIEADLVIVDLGVIPPAALRVIQDRTSLSVVVAPSAGEEERIAMLDHGADYVLHGDVSMGEIVAQARSAARRLPGAVLSAVVTPKSGAVVLDDGRRQAVVFGRRVALTALEWKLLSVFIAAPGRTFSKADLMLAVSGSTVGARSTVSAHIRRLRMKIEPDPQNPVLIRTTWGSGYLFHPDVPVPVSASGPERP